MDPIRFSKMSGSGNDFILIDNRSGAVPETELAEIVRRVCRRKLSVGADGLILVEPSVEADFRWRFFNSDGSPAEMCGNGARCAARFAVMEAIAGPTLAFETEAGLVEAQVAQNGRVKLRMTDPFSFSHAYPLELQDGTITVSSINTGVPHVICQVDDLEKVHVAAVGREIRYHPRYAPEGTNANFITRVDDGTIAIRTYERGVEGETLACGTGSVAAALVTAHQSSASSPIDVVTRSGSRLRVYFGRRQGRFTNVYLEGDARLIYRAKMSEEAWDEV
jgi:diaminopimelate epimerase